MRAAGFLQPAGIIGSIIGAIIVLLVYLKVGKGRTASRLTHPGTTLTPPFAHRRPLCGGGVRLRKGASAVSGPVSEAQNRYGFTPVPAYTNHDVAPTCRFG